MRLRRHRHGARPWLGAAGAVGAMILTAGSAIAAPAERHDFALPPQPLGAALRAVALASARNVVAASALVDGKQAPALSGRYTSDEAIALLLAGSGLHIITVGNSLVIAGDRASSDPVTADAKSAEIVVTGTRIRGAAPAGSNVITIDREAIERSGYATTQQVLQSLPQNFGGGPNEGTTGFTVRNNANSNFGFGSSVNLRGLGATSTLVLIDGNRIALGGASGTFVDLSLIPSTAIDRVEVLADGASALYGSDAVAGVVNVRLRNDYQGFDTQLRYGSGRGFSEVQASQLAGVKWSSGHLTLAYEYYRRDPVPAAGRAYVTEDLRPFGGPDYRRDFANPGTITAADGSVFGIPHGQDGVGLTAGDLIAGRPNLSDGRAGTDVAPATERHAVLASLRQELGPVLTLRAQGFFAARSSSTRTYPDDIEGAVVPATNPFYVDPIGTQQPITVNYNFTKDLGFETELVHVRTWSTIAAIDAKIGRWTATADGSYAVQDEHERTVNIPNYYALGLALADPNPASAYNVLGDGSFTNPATIAKIRGFYDQTGQSRIASAGVRAEGPVFALPAGDLRLAVGGEYRREHYSVTNTDFEFTPTPVDPGSAGFPLGRSIAAAYAELRIPVVDPAMTIPGVNRLDVSVAGRFEHYSDFGNTTNPKVGVSWQPVAGLTARGTFGTSFRAPSFVEFRQGKGTSFVIPIPVPDPASPTGSTTALALFGNSPNVGPEKARTWTAGLDLQPAGVPGAHFSLTYFDIRYRDRIASLGVDYQLFLANRPRYQSLIVDNPSAALIAGYYADPNFSNPYEISASAITVILDGRTKNLSAVEENGLDFDLGYTTKVGRTTLTADLSGSYLFRIAQQLTPTDVAADIVSTIGNPVDLRLRGSAVATHGKLSAAAFVNYVDGYRNNAVMPAESVRSYTTVDLQLAYDLGRTNGLLKGLKLALSVTNLFDRDPPYVNNATPYSAAGFDPENASAFGRLVAVQISKQW